MLHWFGDEAFSKDWLIEQFDKAKIALGARYTPETNVELPIRRDFLAFARDDELQRQLDRWFIKISDEGGKMSESIVRVANGAAQPHSMALKAVVNVLTGKLGAPAVGPESKYPIADWLEALTRCMEAIHPHSAEAKDRHPRL